MNRSEVIYIFHGTLTRVPRANIFDNNKFIRYHKMEKTEKISTPGVMELRKLFAMYLDCEYEVKIETFSKKALIFHQNTIDIQFLNRFHHHGDDFQFNEFWILVKPLSKISDEDKLAVFKILRYKDGDPMNILVGGFCQEILSSEYTMYRIDHALEAIDYLRSRGYALPYKQWSVDQLVKFGIFKLIKDDNTK